MRGREVLLSVEGFTGTSVGEPRNEESDLLLRPCQIERSHERIDGRSRHPRQGSGSDDPYLTGLAGQIGFRGDSGRSVFVGRTTAGRVDQIGHDIDVRFELGILAAEDFNLFHTLSLRSVSLDVVVVVVDGKQGGRKGRRSSMEKINVVAGKPTERSRDTRI